MTGRLATLSFTLAVAPGTLSMVSSNLLRSPILFAIDKRRRYNRVSRVKSDRYTCARKFCRASLYVPISRNSMSSREGKGEQDYRSR